jgi:hypothetical protein
MFGRIVICLPLTLLLLTVAEAQFGASDRGSVNLKLIEHPGFRQESQRWAVSFSSVLTDRLWHQPPTACCRDGLRRLANIPSFRVTTVRN